MLRYIYGTLALVLAAANAPAEDKLEWKFKEGDKFYVEAGAAEKATLKVLGTKTELDVISTQVIRFTVLKSTDKGTVLKEEILSAKSTGKGSEEPAKLFPFLKGAVFTVTLNPDGEVTKLEGYNALIKKIERDDEDAGKKFRLLITEQTLRETGAVFSFLPGKAVAKGGKWKKALPLSLGPLGSLKTEYEYTYQGKGSEGGRISFTGTATYSPPGEANKDAPFKITKGALKAENMKGTVLFDVGRGRITRYQSSLDLKGSLTVEVMGMEVEMSLDEKITGKVRFSDKAPSDD